MFFRNLLECFEPKKSLLTRDIIVHLLLEFFKKNIDNEKTVFIFNRTKSLHTGKNMFWSKIRNLDQGVLLYNSSW